MQQSTNLTNWSDVDSVDIVPSAGALLRYSVRLNAPVMPGQPRVYRRLKVQRL